MEGAENILHERFVEDFSIVIGQKGGIKSDM